MIQMIRQRWYELPQAWKRWRMFRKFKLSNCHAQILGLGADQTIPRLNYGPPSPITTAKAIMNLQLLVL